MKTAVLLLGLLLTVVRGAVAATLPGDPRVARVAIAQSSLPFTLGAYGYDGAGNVKSIGTDQFRYDAFGRLKTANVSGSTQQFGYDRFGNLTSFTTDGTTTTIGVEAATNHLSASASTNVYGRHDAAGNLVEQNGGASTFSYDELGTMKGSTVAGHQKVYLYTVDDERVAAVTISGTAETTSEWTIRDLSGKALRRYAKTMVGGEKWSWKEDYIYREGQLLAAEVDTPERTLHFHLDHLGTPRLVTGNGGAKVAQHTYRAFGSEITPANQDAERLKFTSQERDFANGSTTDPLDYMHARYYNPSLGRFLSVDPGGFDPYRPQSWNRYAYVTNNPVNKFDRDGREEVTLGPPRPETLAKWTPEQRAAENLKNAARGEAAVRGELVVTRVEGRSNLRAQWVNENGPVPSGQHIDHTIDRQLGGSNSTSNGAPLDPSVNTSNGARTSNVIRDMAPGTRITAFRSTVLGFVPYMGMALNVIGYSVEFKKEHGRVPNLGEVSRFLRDGDRRTDDQIWDAAVKSAKNPI